MPIYHIAELMQQRPAVNPAMIMQTVVGEFMKAGIVQDYNKAEGAEEAEKKYPGASPAVLVTTPPLDTGEVKSEYTRAFHSHKRCFS